MAGSPPRGRGGEVGTFDSFETFGRSARSIQSQNDERSERFERSERLLGWRRGGRRRLFLLLAVVTLRSLHPDVNGDEVVSLLLRGNVEMDWRPLWCRGDRLAVGALEFRREVRRSDRDDIDAVDVDDQLRAGPVDQVGEAFELNRGFAMTMALPDVSGFFLGVGVARFRDCRGVPR